MAIIEKICMHHGVYQEGKRVGTLPNKKVKSNYLGMETAKLKGYIGHALYLSCMFKIINV